MGGWPKGLVKGSETKHRIDSPRHCAFMGVVIMAKWGDLEARIQVLEDLEAIRKLKAKYWRSGNKKLWDELVQCFSEDAVMEYPRVGRFQGAEAILRSLREHASQYPTAIHLGHDPDIDVVSDTAARGTWELHFYAIDAGADTAAQMWGLYEDEYLKEKGEWKIKNTKFVDIFRESFRRKG